MAIPARKRSRSALAVAAVPWLLLLLLPALGHTAEERPKVVQDIIDSVRPNIDRAKAEYGRKAKAENDKIVAAIRKALDAATKSGKLDEAVTLKAALEKAANGEILNEMLSVSAEDLLEDGAAVDRDVVVFRKDTLARSGWKTAGGVEFVKDPAVRGAEVAVLRTGCLFKDNFPEIQNGPLFAAMWMRYDGGAGGSLIGIGTKAQDELSLLGLAEGRLGTYSGWPATGKVTSAMAVTMGKWTYLACQWDKAGMTVWIDGKEAGRIPTPALEGRTGRLEIGVNTPGASEYTDMSIGTLRLMPGKIIPADAVARYMKIDSDQLRR